MKTKIPKIDKVMANMIIKRGNFAIENKGKLTQMYANIFVENEVTQVIFFVETKNKDKMIEFRDILAEYITKYRRAGKKLNPFVNISGGM